ELFVSPAHSSSKYSLQGRTMAVPGSEGKSCKRPSTTLISQTPTHVDSSPFLSFTLLRSNPFAASLALRLVHSERNENPPAVTTRTTPTTMGTTLVGEWVAK